MLNKSFYRNKKVLVTGHTGFKGTWLTKLLLLLGADVCGYSLAPKDNEILYDISNVDNYINSDHIDSWVYSGENAQKMIRTDF